MPSQQLVWFSDPAAAVIYVIFVVWDSTLVCNNPFDHKLVQFWMNNHLHNYCYKTCICMTKHRVLIAAKIVQLNTFLGLHGATPAISGPTTPCNMWCLAVLGTNQNFTTPSRTWTRNYRSTGCQFYIIPTVEYCNLQWRNVIWCPQLSRRLQGVTLQPTCRHGRGNSLLSPPILYCMASYLSTKFTTGHSTPARLPA